MSVCMYTFSTISRSQHSHPISSSSRASKLPSAYAWVLPVVSSTARRSAGRPSYWIKASAKEGSRRSPFSLNTAYFLALSLSAFRLETSVATSVGSSILCVALGFRSTRPKMPNTVWAEAVERARPWREGAGRDDYGRRVP